MSLLDFVVLVGTMVGIAAYGIWRTRGRPGLSHYLKGDRPRAGSPSASRSWPPRPAPSPSSPRPGQGYQDGLGFVQNYFGAPLALIVIAAVFLPMYRRLERLHGLRVPRPAVRRQDAPAGRGPVPPAARPRGRDHHLRAGDHPLDRAGLAPDATILLTGLVVIVYTVAGGSEAVNLTQKYQIGVIFCGMVAAFVVLLRRSCRRR